VTQALPLGVAALLVLLLVQLPSALRLARSVERGDAAQRRLLSQAVAASDLERRRIARDLHDDVIQDLAGVAYALESAEPRLADDARPLVTRAREILRRDVATLREMLVELYPADLDSVGLPRAIVQLADPLRRDGVDVRVDVPDVHVDATSATLLYRVARESLANAAKHAQARRVDVRLLDRPDELVLVIEDDGRGFDTASASARGHLGLRLIRDTVAEAGGSVSVSSTEGVGTCIEVRLPRA
jgi:two-component system, NarL family, sensor kinase